METAGYGDPRKYSLILVRGTWVLEIMTAFQLIQISCFDEGARNKGRLQFDDSDSPYKIG